MPAIPPADLARIAVPTTLIWGRHDLATRLRGRRGRQRAPRMAAARDRGLRGRPADRAARGVPGARSQRRALGADASTRSRRPASGARSSAAATRATTSCARVFNGDDRPPPGADRPLRRRARRGGRGRLRPRRAACRVSVYGGGHNVTGNAVCDDGVTIDLRPMKGIDDRPRGAHLPRRGRAHVGRARRRHPGARPRGDRRADVDHRPRRPRARRRLGLDRAQVRLRGRQPALGRDRDGRRADPDRVRRPRTRTCSGARAAAAATSAWSTSFEFRLHPIGPTVLAGMLLYPAADGAPRCWRNFRDVMADAADEIGAGVALLTAPHDDVRPRAGARAAGRRRDRLPRRTGRGRRGRRCDRCASSARRRSTWSSRCPTSPLQQLIDAELPGRDAQLLDRATSSPGCPTRRSRSCAASTCPSPRR